MLKYSVIGRIDQFKLEIYNLNRFKFEYDYIPWKGRFLHYIENREIMGKSEIIPWELEFIYLLKFKVFRSYI